MASHKRLSRQVPLLAGRVARNPLKLLLRKVALLYFVLFQLILNLAFSNCISHSAVSVNNFFHFPYTGVNHIRQRSFSLDDLPAGKNKSL